MTQYKYHLYECPLGWIAMLGSKQGLRRLSLKPEPQEALDELGPDLDRSVNDPSGFTEVQDCLEKYLQGDTSALEEIVLDLSNTPPFFSAAWEACRGIPPGETRSYAWLAAAAGSPLAVRAAGQAMARNRFVLIVPCHRVIASDGDLRGYGVGGLRVKAKLLQQEQENASQRAG